MLAEVPGFSRERLMIPFSLSGSAKSHASEMGFSIELLPQSHPAWRISIRSGDCIVLHRLPHHLSEGGSLLRCAKDAYRVAGLEP